MNETASLEQQLTEEVGVAVDRVYMNAMYPERFDAEEAAKLERVLEITDGARARGDPRRRSPSTAVGARRPRSSSGWRRSVSTPVKTLPFIFKPRARRARAAAARRGADVSALMANVGEILEDREICICAGSGGVGKTTTSAALAAGLAARGQKVAVLTIDPAKRLADSLGLEELGNEPRQVDPRCSSGPGSRCEGELWAMMLDAKATFDELVRKHAPDEETRDRILENRIYRQISNALAGIAGVHGDGEAVRDPPGGPLRLPRPRHPALAERPRLPRRAEAADAVHRGARDADVHEADRASPTKVVGRGSSMMFGVLKRVVGIDLLADLGEFFQAFSGMVDGFRERAERVNELLADPATCFMIVCGPQGEPIEEAVYFHRKLVEAEAAGRRGDRQQGPLRDRGRPRPATASPTS